MGAAIGMGLVTLYFDVQGLDGLIASQAPAKVIAQGDCKALLMCFVPE